MNDAHKPPLEVYSAEGESVEGVFFGNPYPALSEGEVSSGALRGSGVDISASPSESACPTCGRKPPAPKKHSKLRGSKTIKVPKDADENGVELLEDLIAQSEEKLYPNERPRSPYFTLIAALYFFVTNYAGEPA